MIDQWNNGQKKNDIEMYPTHTEEKSVVPKKFIRTLN